MTDDNDFVPEIARLADDGCPHEEDDTQLETPGGPMSVEEALADPAAFVRGMTESRTYCVFVSDFSPTIVASLTRDDPRYQPCNMEPFHRNGKSGTLVTTTSVEVQNQFANRFLKS